MKSSEREQQDRELAACERVVERVIGLLQVLAAAGPLVSASAVPSAIRNSVRRSAGGGSSSARRR